MLAETETRKSPLSMAEIEAKLKELKDIKKEQDANLQNLQSNAFQLANYYFVFQGVIITAICSGTSALNCSDMWFLFTVSLLAAILNIVAICLIGIKYMRVITQRDQNWCEICQLEIRRSGQDSLPSLSAAPPPNQAAHITSVDQAVTSFSKRDSGAGNSGPDQAYAAANDADISTSADQLVLLSSSREAAAPFFSSSSERRSERGSGAGNSGQCKDRYKDFKHYLIFGVCMGLFVGFAGVTLYNCWHIVCRKNQVINNSYLDRNCIRLCDAIKCIRVCSQL